MPRIVEWIAGRQHEVLPGDKGHSQFFVRVEYGIPH